MLHMGTAHHLFSPVGQALHGSGRGLPLAVTAEGLLLPPALRSRQKVNALAGRLHPQNTAHRRGAALPTLGGAGTAGQKQEQKKHQCQHTLHPCLLWFRVFKALSRNFTRWVGQRMTPWPFSRSLPEAAKGVR